jgi:general secretion pathway protein D
MANRPSLFSVPPCVTRLMPLAVLVAGLSVPQLSVAGPATNKKESRKQKIIQAAPEAISAQAASLEAEGDTAMAEGRAAEAAGRYAAALQQIPSPSAAYDAVVAKFVKASLVLADEQAKNGEIDKAVSTLNNVLDERVSPKNKAALALRDRIQDADRYNPAQSPSHVEATKKVRDLFVLAEGSVARGDYKAAQGCYNQILAMDATNSAARRGLEHVEKLTSDYLLAARDHTRLKMLTDVDRLWETPVTVQRTPGKMGAGGDSKVAEGYSPASIKMKTLVLDRVAMSDTPIREALTYLSRKSRELDVAEPNEDARGVNIVFIPGIKPESGFPAVTLDLKSVTLGEALKSVADLTGTRLSTQSNTITVSPVGEGSRIVVRRFRVSPGFLTKSGTADVEAGAAGGDPFASGGDKGESSGLKISKVSAKDWLIRNGVPFPEGTGADYSPAENVLIVRNTEENLALVDTVVESTTDKTQRQVLVTVTMLKAEQRNLNELGYDWLLGASNLGSTGVFLSGGTAGNAAGEGGALASNYSFVDPSTGLANGVNPVTAGLRGAGNLANNPTIDDLLVGGTARATGRSPGIMSLAGVWTDPQVSMIMRGLNQKKGIDISTAQKLVLKAGQRASASSIRQIPYPTEFDPPQIPQTIANPRLTVLFDDGSILDTGGGGGQAPVTPTTPQSFEFKDTGSTLEVEATVGADGHTVDISVSAIFSEFDGFINYGTPITTGDVVLTDNNIFQPVFSKVAVNTPSLSIADGSTVTLGGLSQGKWSTIEDKVPLLGDIPFVGRFFRSDVKEVTRKAVVYFIKVQVVDPGGVGMQEAAAVAEKSVDDSAIEPR